MILLKRERRPKPFNKKQRIIRGHKSRPLRLLLALERLTAREHRLKGSALRSVFSKRHSQPAWQFYGAPLRRFRTFILERGL